MVTYSASWGIRTASLVWLGALILAAIATLPLANTISFLLPMACIVTLIIVMGIWAAYGFINNPIPVTSKRIELASAIVILVLYLGIGPLPLLLR